MRTGNGCWQHPPVLPEESIAMRSATRSSRIMSIMLLPSTYSEWLRVSKPSGLKLGVPSNWVIRSAIKLEYGQKLTLENDVVFALQESFQAAAPVETAHPQAADRYVSTPAQGP